MNDYILHVGSCYCEINENDKLVVVKKFCEGLIYNKLSDAFQSARKQCYVTETAHTKCYVTRVSVFTYAYIIG